MRPAEILALPAGGWEAVLFAAWSRAAITQRDQEWLVPLTNVGLAGAAADAWTLRQLVRRVDPALVASGPGADVFPTVLPDVRDAVGLLRFRYQMLKELDDDDGTG
jgi:hypothetical protein